MNRKYLIKPRKVPKSLAIAQVKPELSLPPPLFHLILAIIKNQWNFKQTVENDH